MHTNEPKEDPLVELGYDHRDVNYKSLTKSIIIFLVFGFLTTIVGAIIYTNRFFVFQIPEPKPGIDAVLPRATPPSGTPFVQDNVASKTDIMTLRQGETKRLTGTGYTDDTHEYAYIPIEKAMEMVTERGVAGSGKGVADKFKLTPEEAMAKPPISSQSNGDTTAPTSPVQPDGTAPQTNGQTH